MNLSETSVFFVMKEDKGYFIGQEVIVENEFFFLKQTHNDFFKIVRCICFMFSLNAYINF